MQSARKVTLIPPKQENQIGGGSEEMVESGILTTQVEKPNDKIKSKIYDKIHRFIKVILRLARTVGYDEDLRIKLKNGKYLEKSNIVDLLTHAMSVGKVLYGENEFIELLAQSDVDPNLIINENVKIKLIQYKNRNKNTQLIEIEEPNNIVTDNTTSKKLENMRSEKIKVVKKGPKKYITVNEDGATLDLDSRDENDMIGVEEASTKRKYDELDETDDSIDDDLIDERRWKVNKV